MKTINKIKNISRNLSVKNKERIVVALNVLLVLSVVVFYQAGMNDRIVLAAITGVYVNTMLKNSIKAPEIYHTRSG